MKLLATILTLPMAALAVTVEPLPPSEYADTEVETVCRRVDPDDYDGDGWRNDDDPDPYNPDDFYDMFSQELPEGANEAAYYWVDIRPRWNSDIGFYGDAPSNLVDPYVCGKAGETYRVRLLVGKTYFVESSQPVDIVGRSSPSIEVDGWSWRRWMRHKIILV